jgi:hypothetical protein
VLDHISEDQRAGFVAVEPRGSLPPFPPTFAEALNSKQARRHTSPQQSDAGISSH